MSMKKSEGERPRKFNLKGVNEKVIMSHRNDALFLGKLSHGGIDLNELQKGLMRYKKKAPSKGQSRNRSSSNTPSHNTSRVSAKLHSVSNSREVSPIGTPHYQASSARGDSSVNWSSSKNSARGGRTVGNSPGVKGSRGLGVEIDKFVKPRNKKLRSDSGSYTSRVSSARNSRIKNVYSKHESISNTPQNGSLDEDQMPRYAMTAKKPSSNSSIEHIEFSRLRANSNQDPRISLNQSSRASSLAVDDYPTDRRNESEDRGYVAKQPAYQNQTDLRYRSGPQSHRVERISIDSSPTPGYNNKDGQTRAMTSRHTPEIIGSNDLVFTKKSRHSRMHSDAMAYISAKEKYGPSAKYSKFYSGQQSTKRAKSRGSSRLNSSLKPRRTPSEKNLSRQSRDSRPQTPTSGAATTRGSTSGRSSANSRRTLSRRESPSTDIQAKLNSSSNNSFENSLIQGSGSMNNTSVLYQLLCLEKDLRDREKLIRYIRETLQKTNEPLITNTNFYIFGRSIGKGAFGKVNLGLHKLTGENVAVKRIDKKYMKDEHHKKKIFQEVAILKLVRHKNIVRLFEVFEDDRYLYLVMEYADGGDLLKYVKEKTRLFESEARYIFKQIVEGLGYCHKHKILHRDIKLDNILLDSNFNVKICDFGVSRWINVGESITEQCGTPAYIAPEIISDDGYDNFYVDIWSLGVCLYAMLNGTVPFKASNMSDLKRVINRGKYDYTVKLSPECKDLLNGLLDTNRKDRLTVPQILEHPWLTNIGSSFTNSSLGTLVGNDESVGFDSEEETQKKMRFAFPRGYEFTKTMDYNIFETENNLLDQQVLKYVENFGFPRHFIISSLNNGELNHATATYYLILLNNSK